MSMYSDYAWGYLDEDEYRHARAQFNREEAYYEEHMYDRYEDEEEEYDEE